MVACPKNGFQFENIVNLNVFISGGKQKSTLLGDYRIKTIGFQCCLFFFI